MTTAMVPASIATLVDTLAAEVPARTEALLGEIWVLGDGDGLVPALGTAAWLVGLVLVVGQGLRATPP